MKKEIQSLVIIMVLSLFGVKLAGQCITVGSNQTICQGGTKSSLGGGGTATSASWTSSVSGGTFSPNENDIAATWAPPSLYSGSATLTLTSTDGGCAGSASLTVNVLPTPTAGIGGTIAVCKDASSPDITFTNPQTNDITITYDINGSGTTTIDVNASSSATLAASTSSSGVFNYNITSVAYKVLPLCTNVVSATATVTVNDVPGTPDTPTPSASSICQGSSSTTYTTSATGATSYTWNITGSGNSVSGTGTTGTVTWDPTFSGSATISVIANNGCGSSSSSSTTVNVLPTPTAGIGGTTTVCKDASSPNITFTNTNTLPVTVTYNINGSGTYTINIGASSTANVPVSTATEGVFAYNMVSVAYQSSPFCSASISGTATVNVSLLPVPVISGPASACVTSTGNVYTTETGMTNYVWNISGGGTISSGGTSGDNTVTVTWNSDGPQTVKVGYTNLSGCASSSQTTFNVTVVPKPSPSNVQITGTLRVYATLTVSYDYSPGVCFPEDLTQTEISWYKANSSSGAGSGLIVTKTGLDKTLVLSSSELGKYIQVRVKLSDGTTLMGSVSSTGWIGSVAANSAPVASGVTITGASFEINQTLTGNYTYTDAELDAEGASTYEWYRANNSSGSSPSKITGATSQTYVLTTSDRDKYISFKVTPKAISGTTPGTAVSSAWSGPVINNTPVASNVTISGNTKVSSVLIGHYQYSDSEGDIEGSSNYKWYTGTNSSGAGSTQISLATSISYTLTNNEIGKYIGFSVEPVAQTGSTPGTMVTSITWVGPVTNDAPVATILPITGSKDVGGVLTGHYTYSDSEGDTENGSEYKWYSSSSSGGPYDLITGETGIAHVITMDEHGKWFMFYVTPKTISGTTTGTTVHSAAYGPANTEPKVNNVEITGTATLGSTLAGSYSYNDTDGDPEGATVFRWIRNGTDVISGATGISYVITDADEGYSITFEVTPVSSAGYPNVGVAVKSSPTAAIIDPSPSVPTADQVCIEGIRSAGQILQGKYHYNFYKSEGVSSYQWYRNGVPIAGATGMQYTLDQVLDIDSDADITFEVTPKSSNRPAKVGPSEQSNPLARITIPKVNFSVAEPDVILTANVMGGIFSGTGVYGGVFSPEDAGSAGSPYTIRYMLTILNTNHNCTQQDSKQVTVNPNVTYFDGFDPVYCHDGGTDVVNVMGIPAGSTIIGFSCTDPDAIDSHTDASVTINPGNMRPGVNVDVLSFSYYNLGLFYQINQSFVIDSVGTAMRLINLDTAYCEGDSKKYITVEGVYPLGGTAEWDGDIISPNLPANPFKPTAASAYLDPSLAIPGTKYTIKYKYKSPKGCYSSQLSKNVTVNPLPDPGFDLNATYNIDGGEIELKPFTSGGRFSGDGVSGTKLFPDIAGLDDHVITYSITDEKNCYASLGKPTKIREAIGEITDIPSIICFDDITYNVKVTGLPTTGIDITDFTNKKNTLVYTPEATTANYYVPAAGAGYDTLIFSYKWDGVDYWLKKAVNIDDVGQVAIKNLSPGQIVCDNIAPYELFTTIGGGVFTGPVTAGYLDPSKASGSTAVSYTYVNMKTGCSTSTNVPITIYPSPKVSFSPADNCIENKSDTTFFVNGTTSVDDVQSWLWEFTDAGGLMTNTNKNAGYLYLTGGLHKISLTAKTVNGCTANKELTVDFGLKPVADFYWTKDCMNPNDSIKLFDASTSTNPILSRSWNLVGGPLFSTEKNTSYLKADTGYMKFRYIVRTSYASCSDTVIKSIYIRPTVQIPVDGYFQDFETGNSGWAKDEAVPNNWSFGIPDRLVINKASSGKNAWFTRYDMSKPVVESSSVVSPCFDFTNIERPMIKLKLWKRFEKEKDGAALQYKVGDENEWHYVGTLDDGINWFNSPLIKGRPGGEQIGWTTLETPDTSWNESNHTLDGLKGKRDVKFRIAYGTDGSYADHDGVAFDDIWIGERSRNVLLEHFTNITDISSSSSNILVNSVSSRKSEDVVNIQYHTNFPGSDPFYDNNPGDVSARVLFYGLTRTPYTYIDGGTKKDYANFFDNYQVKLDSNDVSRRSLISSRFDISITPEISGGVLTIRGQVKALEDINSNNLVLFLAVTEKENKNYTGALGEKVFYNIFKKFIPDAGGITLKSTWTKNEVYTIPEKTWPIEKILNSSDIEIIAFVQNSVSKEVFQATSVLKPDVFVGIENPSFKEGTGFALYPNPAVNKLTIEFKESLEKDTEINIYNLQGVIVKSYMVSSGSTEFVIDDVGLKGGIYLVRISEGLTNLGYKKLIIYGE
jgi:hypothetical protein